MKILTISPVPLFPIRTGLELRIYNLLKPLCERHQISQLSFSLDEELSQSEQEHLDQLFDIVVTVPQDQEANAPESALSRIISWFSPQSVSFGPFGNSKSMEESLEQLLEENDFDLIFVASAFVLNYVLKIGYPPIVFDAIDDTSLLFRREIKRKKGLLAKLMATKDWLIVRQTEKKFYSRFKEIVLTSPTDAETMRSLCPGSNIKVIPNGVSAREYNNDHELSKKPSLVFTGVMNYAPNHEAMIFFISEILPLITKQQPDVELFIVGRDPNPDLIELGQSNENVTVTGSVDDLKPYIGRAWVYICPLISGAGIKNKVLEAWAASTPLVATSLSCEGINVAPDKDILVSDEPSDFAADVLKLINDRQLSDNLARAGREKVLAEYDWESKARALEDQFVRAVEPFDNV